MTMPGTLAEVVNDFQEVQGQDKLALLLEFADELPPLPAERERLVGQPYVRRIGVGFGVDGNARQPGILGRPDHPDRDLPTIGDKHLGDLRAGVTRHCAS